MSLNYNYAHEFLTRVGGIVLVLLFPHAKAERLITTLVKQNSVLI